MIIWIPFLRTFEVLPLWYWNWNAFLVSVIKSMRRWNLIIKLKILYPSVYSIHLCYVKLRGFCVVFMILENHNAHSECALAYLCIFLEANFKFKYSKFHSIRYSVFRWPNWYSLIRLYLEGLVPLQILMRIVFSTWLEKLQFNATKFQIIQFRCSKVYVIIMCGQRLLIAIFHFFFLVFPWRSWSFFHFLFPYSTERYRVSRNTDLDFNNKSEHNSLWDTHEKVKLIRWKL